MTDLLNYLHDVFVIKFDAWVVLGFVAQGLFTMRFVVQWIASERARAIPACQITASLIGYGSGSWIFSVSGG